MFNKNKGQIVLKIIVSDFVYSIWLNMAQYGCPELIANYSWEKTVSNFLFKTTCYCQRKFPLRIQKIRII